MLDIYGSLRDTIGLLHEKGSKVSELAKILMVGFHLLARDCSSDYLADQVCVSLPTIKRYILELRVLGCEIVSRREPGGWVYRLENARAVEARLCSWLDLELNRTLL